ncbi:MAG: hypothetical protein U5K38_04020 [Woeseiaceae bacterium]|nr:hypothetical protein [Woeseiaceae bacterium]
MKVSGMKMVAMVGVLQDVDFERFHILAIVLEQWEIGVEFRNRVECRAGPVANLLCAIGDELEPRLARLRVGRQNARRRSRERPPRSPASFALSSIAIISGHDLLIQWSSNQYDAC